MNVVAVELGERPVLFTNARRFAPEGVKVLAELMGHLEFATDGIIILDWTDQLNQQPDGAAIPVVIVRATKVFPEFGETNNQLTVEVRLDVEDLFGNDNVTASELVDVVHQVEAYFLKTLSQRRSQ